MHAYVRRMWHVLVLFTCIQILNLEKCALNIHMLVLIVFHACPDHTNISLGL
jgi:hypothetical protein